MTARTHNAIAFATLTTAAAFYQPKDVTILTFAGSIIAAEIGALLPDMDQAGNNLWNLFPARNFFGKLVRNIFYKHRTITHSLAGLYLIYKLFGFLLPKFLNPNFVNPQIILFSLMIGYISHIIADGFTEEGVPLLFPLPFAFGMPPIKSWRIKTGHWFEKFIVFPGVWVYVIWFIHTRQDTLLAILRSIRK